MPAPSAALDLIVQYVNDASSEARQREYDYCLRRNLNNPWIRTVHNLAEADTVVPADVRDHPKYRESRMGRWFTFQDAFEYVNRELAGEVVCVSNLDIILDNKRSDWRKAAKFVTAAPLVLCLARHELDENLRPHFDPDFAAIAYANAQDAWVFKAPVKVPDCDFEIGTLGCDNAIADRFRRGGLMPINMQRRFKVFHYDVCRGKNGANTVETHRRERHQHRVRDSHPEQRGQWLLPDYDTMKSVDRLCDRLKLNALQRYEIICYVMSAAKRVENPD